MKKKTVSIKDDWAELLNYLPAGYHTLAKEMKQLEVQYGNAKITKADELLRFLFVHAGAGLPLRQTVAVVEGGGGPSISHVTLHQKMCRAVSSGAGQRAKLRKSHIIGGTSGRLRRGCHRRHS